MAASGNPARRPSAARSASRPLNGTAAARSDEADRVLLRIRELLERDYLRDHPQACVAVKRFTPDAVRVRIIDPAFEGVLLTERDPEVWNVLEQLPDNCFGEIAMLVLVSPSETRTSWANQEFEGGPVPATDGVARPD
ncbi:MAG: hypothetical protein JNM56_12445 [Planctomycetia bacterium]|nr:hypothetical protein [Planctomycetia bacterium]